MINAPVVPCRSIMGSIGQSFVFGRNKYGPWVAPKTWTKENREGGGGWEAFYISELAAIWHDMTQGAKDSWKKLSTKWRITNYTAYIKVNMLRIQHSRPTIQTFTGEL